MILIRNYDKKKVWLVLHDFHMIETVHAKIVKYQTMIIFFPNVSDGNIPIHFNLKSWFNSHCIRNKACFIQILSLLISWLSTPTEGAKAQVEFFAQCQR